MNLKKKLSQKKWISLGSWKKFEIRVITGIVIRDVRGQHVLWMSTTWAFYAVGRVSTGLSVSSTFLRFGAHDHFIFTSISFMNTFIIMWDPLAAKDLSQNERNILSSVLICTILESTWESPSDDFSGDRSVGFLFESDETETKSLNLCEFKPNWVKIIEILPD